MSRRRQARRSAIQRAADNWTNKPSAIVAEEWRRHGLEPPTGVVMDRWADQIADPPSLAEQTVNNARILRDLVGLRCRVHRATKGGIGPLIERMGKERGRAYEVATGDEMIEATTEPGSTSYLDELAARAVGFPWVASAF